MQMTDYGNDENILEKFGRNINDACKNGKVDPVIGRDEEIRSITTYNLILNGEFLPHIISSEFPIKKFII